MGRFGVDGSLGLIELSYTVVAAMYIVEIFFFVLNINFLIKF